MVEEFNNKDNKSQNNQAATRLDELIKNAIIESSVCENTKKKHEFWNTQPVPQLGENVNEESNKPLHNKLKREEIMKEPYALPAEFEWVEVDVHNSQDMDDLFCLLRDNYVSDNQNMFRFKYSKEFLLWALCPPGYRMFWHVGIREKSNNKLVGFISSVPVKLTVHGKLLSCVEVNFLCLVPEMRGKRFAPILIQEITRRAHIKGIFQALYSGGQLLSKPFMSTRYYHRNLNIKKVIESKFGILPENMTMKMAQKFFAIPEKHTISGVREMKPKDAPAVTKLLKNYLEKLKISYAFNEDKVKYYFLSRPNVVYSYVVENDDGEVTDFFSFYLIESSILKHKVHKVLRVAYIYFIVCNKHSIDQVAAEALVAAKNIEADVFNALDVMEHRKFFDELKFSVGDGVINFYLFNWACAPADSDQVGLMLR